MKRSHRSHVKYHHNGPIIRKGFQFIAPTCYVSYLNNLYICATVNTAITHLYHGILSVRYVALYDRIERKWHVFVQKCKRFIGNKANLRDLIAATGLVISNWIQIVNFSAHVTVKFDGWPCKTIGHLFYATSSFVHLFVPIGEFKLKLQSGNAQSGSNWMIFRAVRPWNLTDDLAKQ